MDVQNQKTQSQPATPAQPNDDGRYVNKTLLDGLEAFMARVWQSDNASACDAADLRRIERFLFHEARLLDARRYQAWFALLTEDFAYWIPSRYRNASLHKDVSINFDDRRRILDRIAYTESGVQVAQTPPSRTMRSISNIQAWKQDTAHGGAAGFDVVASLVIWTHRRGITQPFSGHLSMMLQPLGDTFAIRARVIELLDADEPQGNNSFIL